MAPKDKNIDEDEIEDEVPYEFANRAAFLENGMVLILMKN